MGRSEEALRVAEELLTDIELRRLAPTDVVLKAGRVARLVGHDELTAFLALEQSGYAGQKQVAAWVTLAGRWIDDKQEKYYSASLATIYAQCESSRLALQTMQGGVSFSGEWANVSSGRHYTAVNNSKSELARYSGICQQVTASVYQLVTTIYHELLFSSLQAGLFAETQRLVDGTLAEASGTALAKIERVSDRLRDADPESISQALTTCRRLIDSCANHVCPPQEGATLTVDGQPLKAGALAVLNRLQFFAQQTGASKSRRDRLRRSLSDIYSRCSAGTHADVDAGEARFVFLQTYITLGELLSLSQGKQLEHSSADARPDELDR